MEKLNELRRVILSYQQAREVNPSGLIWEEAYICGMRHALRLLEGGAHVASGDA